MKKITTTFFAFLFLIANSGMTVNLHWCGGRLASLEIFSPNEHPCSCGKKAMKPNCCKDKTFQLKVKQELYKTIQFTFKVSVAEIDLVATNNFALLPPAEYKNFTSDFLHPPPFKPKNPIYILDRVFLI